VRVLGVLSPAALAKASEVGDDLRRFRARGARVELRRLSHKLGKKRYPASYTAVEVEAMGAMCERLAGAEFDVDGPTALLPHLGCDLELRDWPCYAPMRVLNVGLDGGLWNCYAQPFRPRAQGSLLDGYALEELFARAPRACGYDVCSCRVLGIRYCLEPAGVALATYCAAHHGRAGNRASVRAIVDGA
jgi:hypothetical protein